MATDTAQFVITGIFDPSKMIDGVNAAFRQIEGTMNKGFSNAAKNANSSLGAALRQAGVEAGKAGMSNLGADTKKAGQYAKGLKESFGEIKSDLFIAAKRVVLWGAASRLVFQTFSGIQSALKDIIQLNTILVNIQKIRPAGLPVDVIETNIIDSAKKYGVAFQEIGETQRTFFQQGFNTQEVLKLTEAQLLGVTAAGLSTTESIELLIGSMSIFNIEAEKSLTLIDKLQAVQANYAVSTQDLATAIRRVGPVVEQIGGDIDNLIGVITALKESTRKSGEFIGTALSTVFSRMITPVGATALRNIGVSINKTAVELRPLADILGDLSVAWKGLTDQEKISTAFALGARRRYAQVISLMNNYSTAIDASATSLNAFGAAVSAQQKEVQSVSRQFAIAKETIRATGIALVRAFTGTNKAEDGLRNLAQAIQRFATDVSVSAHRWAFFIKVLGGGIGITLTATATFLLAKRLNLMAIAAYNAAVGAAKAGKGLLGLGAAAEATTKSISKLTVAATFAGKSLQVLAGIAGVGLAILAFIDLNRAMRVSQATAVDLGDAYTDLNMKGIDTDALKEYFAVAKQFRDVKGPEALVKLLGEDLSGTGAGTVLGVLRQMEGVAFDLNNVTFDQYVSALHQVYGESVDVDAAIEDLSNTIGFFQTTLAGVRNELDLYTGTITNTATGLLALLQATSRLGGGGSDSFLRAIFGDKATAASLAKEIEDSIGTLTKVTKDVDIFKDPTVMGQSYDAAVSYLTKRILESGTLIGSYLKDGEEYGAKKAAAVAATIADNLFNIQPTPGSTGIYEALERWGKRAATGNIPENLRAPSVPVSVEIKPIWDVNTADVQKGIRVLLQQAVDPNELQKGLDDIGKSANLDIYTSVMGSLVGDDALMKQVMTFLGEVLPQATKNFANSLVSPIVPLLVLQKAIKTASEEMLYFPVAIHSVLKEMLKFNNSSGEFAASLDDVSFKSKGLGKSLLDLQTSAVSSRIGDGLSKLSKISNIKATIEDLRSLRDRYKEIADADGENEETAKTYGIEVQDLIKRIGELNQEIKDLQSAERFSNIEKEHAIDIVNKQIAIYNLLVDRVVKTESSYKSAVSSSKLYQQAVVQAGQSVVKFIQQQDDLIKQFELLGSTNSFADQLGSEIDSINRSYIQQNALIGKQQASLAKVHGIQIDALKTKFEEQKIDVLGLSATQEREMILQGISKEYGTALSTVQLQAATEAITLEYDKDRLAIAQEQEKNLALMNIHLSQAKKTYEQINSLSQGYASSTADIVKNIKSIVNERGSIRAILTPYADAYVDSVTSRLADSLEEVFKGVASKTVGAQLDELEQKMRDLRETQTAEQSGNIIKMKMIEAAEAGGDIMAAKIWGGGATQTGSGGTSYGTGGSTSTSSKETAKLTGSYVAVGLNSTMMSIAQATKDSGKSQTDRDIDAAKQRSEQLKKQARIDAGIQSMGLVIGGVIAQNNQNAQMGSSFGGSLGSAVAGPLGGFAGSVLGSIFGSFFGGDDNKDSSPAFKPEIYEANTEAIRQNTEAVLQNSQDFSFMARLLNAPSNFILPSAATIGGGVPNVTIEINSPVGSMQELGDTVFSAVSRAYSSTSRRIGRRG